MLLIVKANARVMLTTNIDLSVRLINDQRGIVKYFGINQNDVETIYVAFDDIPGEQTRIDINYYIIARNNKDVPIKAEKASIYLSKFRIKSPAIYLSQFPLMLSWACTVHNVQGLSLNSGITTFDLERNISFIQAQMHVALRRVRDMKNFHTIVVPFMVTVIQMLH